MDDNDLLAFLDPQQREVATYFSGPLCVRAGAGTGKTRAITYRIANGVREGAMNVNNILAVTFTARAASEMRVRLRALGVGTVQARTFHAAALRQLRYFWPHAVGGQLPGISAQKFSLVAQAATSLGVPYDKALIRDILTEVEWAKVSMIPAEAYPQNAKTSARPAINGVEAAQIAEIMARYEEIKTSANTIDFEDVLLLLIGIMLDRPDITRAIRQQYRHFVVDEYQDVSPLQHRLLQLWLGERRSLCVVGDVSQTIYSFAGASSLYLANFSKEFRGAKEVELVRDYRSTPQIVAAANKVISADRSQGAVNLISQLPSGRPVAWHAYGDDEAEGEGVAAQISQLILDGVEPSDIAILYRTNAQSVRFESALSGRGVPFQVRGSEEFFSRREVREAMIALKAMGNVGSGDLSEVVRGVASQYGWAPTAPQGEGALRERWEALDMLVKMADDFARGHHGGLVEFVAELFERAEAKNAPTSHAVTLCSLHAAKGLEWEHVFLVGMSEGLMPISLAKRLEQVAEERRLLYVGITRAKTHLTISYATNARGGKPGRSVSRFLMDLWPKEEKAISTRTSYRRRKKEEEASFAREHPEDQELYATLVRWRRSVAEAADKKAFTVFVDATLREISIEKPTTLSELGRIKGVGATKLALWGEAVIGIVKASMQQSQ